MNRKKQSILAAALVVIVLSAAAAYVTANFDSLWVHDEAVGKRDIEQFSDIRDQQRDQFQLKPLSTNP